MPSCIWLRYRTIRLGDLDPHLTYDINHRASVRLAELAKAAGVKRFVFSSSCSTYGAAGDDLHRRNGATESGHSVRRVEGFSRARYCPAGGRQFQPNIHEKCDCLWRISATSFGYCFERFRRFGVHDWSDLHQERWHPVAAHECTYATSSPRPWPYSRLRQEAIHNETFNVGRTDENYRIRELADIVAETVPGCRVEYALGGGPDKRCYRINCDKIRRVLPGFRRNGRPAKARRNSTMPIAPPGSL